MQALVLEGPCRAVVREVAEPCLSPGGVLVAVERMGICGSDLAVFNGSRDAVYPLIMGHEAVGLVLDPGASAHAAGSRVVIEPNIPCGRCDVCRRGCGNVCPAKQSLGMNCPGSFAELVAVPSEFAHPLPDDMRLEDAVGVEPLAVALHAVAAAHIPEGDVVTVIGCGAEGLLLIQVLVGCGARVVAADLHADRLATALRLGASAVVLVPAEAAHEIEAQLRAPLVFEAAGAAAALELALRVAAPGGQVVALGLGSSAAQLVPLDFVRRGLTLSASLIYEHPTDFQAAIEMVARQQVLPSALVSDVLDGLDAVPAALQALANEGRGGKTVVHLGARR